MAAIFLKLFPQLHPERNCTSSFFSFYFFFFKHSFIFKLPKENEQKRPLWALAFGILLWLQPSSVPFHSGPFMDAERVPASHQFPLYPRKGWLPLRCSHVPVIRLVPPAAWACQQRSEEKGAPGPSFQLALGLHAKSPQAGPCCPEAGAPGICEPGGHWKVGEISPLSAGKGANPQPEGTRSESQERVEAFSCAGDGSQERALDGSVPSPCAAGNRTAPSRTQGQRHSTSRGCPRRAEGCALP